MQGLLWLRGIRRPCPPKAAAFPTGSTGRSGYRPGQRNRGSSSTDCPTLAHAQAVPAQAGRSYLNGFKKMANAFLTRFLSKLTELPRCRRVVWKLVYEVLARRFGFADWHFMNYGFAPTDGTPRLLLDPLDEDHRYSIQLYHDLATRAPIAGKDVLEVGSGRGGGAHYLMRDLKPRRVVGMDLAASAVRLAKRQHRADGLSYVQGDAEHLPFADGSFDVVVNVESCHAYGRVPRFLREVRRVLRPGGHFLCADIRTAHGMRTFREHLHASRMVLLDSIDITRNVVVAMELDEEVKRRRMQGRFPKWVQTALEQFFGFRGSPSHRGLSSGDLVYHEFILRRD